MDRPRIETISLGGALIFLQWLLFTFLPEEMKTNSLILIVMMMTVLVVVLFLPNRKRKNIFSAEFGKDFPKFVIAFIGGVAFLSALDLIFNGSITHVVFKAIAKYGLVLVLLQALVVAINEEIIFRYGLVEILRDTKMKEYFVWIIHAFVFALFHVAVKGSFWMAMIQLPLAFVYLWVKERYTPVSNMANSGVHFAWNVFVLGFTA